MWVQYCDWCDQRFQADTRAECVAARLAHEIRDCVRRIEDQAKRPVEPQEGA